MNLPLLGNIDIAKAGKAADILHSFNFTTPSWDLFILIFFAVAVFIYGFSLGRNRIVVILIAIYMALAVVNTAPFVDKWVNKAVAINGVGQVFAFKLGLFLVVFALLFFLFGRSRLLFSVGSDQRHSGWWQIPIFSILHIGLLLSIALSFLPAESLLQLAPFTREIFGSDIGRFVWITAPIAAMIILPE
jgi:hypothetical protein